MQTVIVLMAVLLVTSGVNVHGLTVGEMETIHMQARGEALRLLMGGGGRSGVITEIPAQVIEKATARIEARLLKAAAIREEAQSLDGGARKLLAEDASLEPEVLEPNNLRRRLQQARSSRPSASMAAPFCSVRENTAYNLVAGISIGSAFINTTDPGECCAACYFRRDCQAWTVKTGLSRDNGCFLRGARYTSLARPEWTSGKMTASSLWNAPAVPPARPLAAGRRKYASVIGLTTQYWAAQRSGKLPADNPIKWRGDAHLDDRVPGGYYDAGDFIKAGLPMSVSATFTAWGMISFPSAFQSAPGGAYTKYSSILRSISDYLLDCYKEEGTRKAFIGQISDPKSDHGYWGRPEEMNMTRLAYVWGNSQPASDLLSSVAAAWASTSLVFQKSNPAYSRLLVSKARSIFAWAVANEGRYSDQYRDGVYTLYPSYDYLDNQAWAAAWLFRATKQRSYLTQAESFWKRSYGKDKYEADVYTNWDSLWGPTAVMMRQIARTKVAVPGIGSYNEFFQQFYLPAWTNANGFFSIVKTPKGMTYPSWNMWGNLQFATTSAMVLVQDARSNPNVTMRREEIAYARGQVDYALGSAGRSYIVGFGNAPPANIRHASSSCPNLPDICDDQNEFQKAPNFQKLNGAMVGGPAGTRRNRSTPDAYVDVRSDFATNEPAIEYAGGLVGALAGVFTYTSK